MQSTVLAHSEHWKNRRCYYYDITTNDQSPGGHEPIGEDQPAHVNAW